MKPVTTRTLNPLPFQDLEPHRFEDLVRQLAYDFRSWKLLEPTGRLGSDEGLDIRAIELVPLDLEEPATDEEGAPSYGERLWTFQCKREKTMPPKRLRKVIKESFASLSAPPHGFVLALACDMSKDARDAFRDEMVTRGVEEFFIWGRSDLEDMLFQPRHDRLLFAYFNVALQPRRRSLATGLRAEIAKKKQLAALIEEDKHDGRLVLLRDPTDDRYPKRPKAGEPPPRWFPCRAVSHQKPGYLVVLQSEHLAATTADGAQWDAVTDFNTMLWTAETELRSKQAWGFEQWRGGQSAPHAFWNEYIDESDRARLQIHRAIPLERILAIDVLGDGPFPIPHLLVEFTETHGPYTPRRHRSLVPALGSHRRIELEPTDTNRTTIFPRPLPLADEAPSPRFDHTTSDCPGLSTAAAARLTELLARTPDDPLHDWSGGNAHEQANPARRQEKLAAFQGWRKTTALPAFSSFAKALRAAGHDARVVVRGDAATAESGCSIELRARLRADGYRPQLAVKISCDGYLPEWPLTLSPSAPELRNAQRSQSGQAPKVNASTTAEDLESITLSVVEWATAAGI